MLPLKLERHLYNRVLLITIFFVSILSSCGPAKPPAQIGDSRLVSPEGAPPFESPDWSSDGKKLLVYSEFDYLHIIDLEKKITKPLPNSDWDTFSNEWSPKGNEVLYIGQHNDGLGVWVLNIEEENVRPHLFSKGNVATWSPSGNQIAVGLTKGELNIAWTTGEIFIQERNSDVQQVIYEAEGNYLGFLELSWSPNRRYLAAYVVSYLTEDLNNPSISTLVIVDLLEDKVIEYTDIQLFGGFNWSPDSEKLLYLHSTHIDSTEFRIVDLEGNCYQLPTNLSLALSPKISPDGSRMAYRGQAGGIYIVSTEKAFGENYWDTNTPCEPEPEP